MAAPESSAPARQATALPTRGEFDEEGYLVLHRDIAAGVAAGVIESGWAHFSQAGFAEGRAWLRRADPFAGVDRRISPRDAMFRGNADHYFDAGESALHCIATAIGAARRPPSTIRRILDLPCGHGRVLRFLRQAYPGAELVACDLDRDGVDFCAATFGATGVYSRTDVEAIPLSGGFDLIWCGSLLTHLDAAQSAAFLALFSRMLDDRGILVFTTHGRRCERELAAGTNRFGLEEAQARALLLTYERSGFGYVDYRDTPGYGFSLMHPQFVTTHLLADPAWSLLGYHEAGWDKRQDAIALQKNARRVGLGI